MKIFVFFFWNKHVINFWTVELNSFVGGSGVVLSRKSIVCCFTRNERIIYNTIDWLLKYWS